MPFKDEIDKRIKAGKAGQAMKLELKRQALAMRRTGGAPNIASIMSVFGKARSNAAKNKDKTTDSASDKGPPNDKFLNPKSAIDKEPVTDTPPPAPPPVPGEATQAMPQPTAIRPVSNRWNDIVGAYFPATGGNVYKEGGLVRGGGAAQRGVGRGKMR